VPNISSLATRSGDQTVTLICRSAAGASRSVGTADEWRLYTQEHRAARRQERKAEPYLFLGFGSRRPRDSAIAEVEAQLPMRLADEIQYRHASFLS
jgi:hypothetical protein